MCKRTRKKTTITTDAYIYTMQNNVAIYFSTLQTIRTRTFHIPKYLRTHAHTHWITLRPLNDRSFQLKCVYDGRRLNYACLLSSALSLFFSLFAFPSPHSTGNDQRHHLYEMRSNASILPAIFRHFIADENIWV